MRCGCTAFGTAAAERPRVDGLWVLVSAAAPGMPCLCQPSACLWTCPGSSAVPTLSVYFGFTLLACLPKGDRVQPSQNGRFAAGD